MLFNAAITSQTQPEAGQSTVSRHGDELDAVERGRLTFTRIIRVPSPLRS